MKLLRKNVAAGPLSFRGKWTKSMKCVVFMNKRFVYRRKLFRLISTFVLIRLRGLTVCLSVSLLDIKQVIFCAEMYLYEFFFQMVFKMEFIDRLQLRVVQTIFTCPLWSCI